MPDDPKPPRTGSFEDYERELGRTTTMLVSAPLPVAVGRNAAGRIVLEYEDTPENREMARRVAEMMGGEDG